MKRPSRILLIALLIALPVMFALRNALPLALLLLFLLPSLAASYFTGLICRRLSTRQQQVHWWHGLAGVVAASVLDVSFVLFGYTLQPEHDVYIMGTFLYLVCLAGSLLAVIPAGIVVWRHRKALAGV